MSKPHPLSVKKGWFGPVMDLFRSMEDPGLTMEQLESMIGRIPDLVREMDHDALVDAIEAALGAATVYGALNSRAADVLVGLSSDDYEAAVGYAPFEQAAASVDARTPIGSRLNSYRWRRVPAELRDRAMFSSRVESVRFLAEARDRLASELRLQRETLANGKQAFFDRDSFIVRMREIAQEEGIDTGAADGSIEDIRSARRLGLIYDTQTEMAEEHGRYRMNLDPDVLDAWPARRLVRVEDRERKRNWAERWRAAANEVDWNGVNRGSDMVALTTSPIWTRLGPFQNPWPPFDYGSGMGTEDVDRETAESLGLVKAAEPVPVPDDTVDFNRNLEAGIEGIGQELREFLAKSFAGQVKIVGDFVRWITT